MCCQLRPSWRDVTQVPNAFVLAGSSSQAPCFLSGNEKWPGHQNQQLSWRPREAQQDCLGSRLEELHVVLWDEASLSIQSPLQPARLLRWVNIVEDGACCEGELRVVFSFAGIQGLCLPERCAVWKGSLFNIVSNPQSHRLFIFLLPSLQAT